MAYVILLIIVVVLILIGVMLRRRSAKRGFGYVPDPNALGGHMNALDAMPRETIATPEAATEEIAHDDFVADGPGDLMDPKNPRHAEWLKEHPEMATDAEWVAEHPEDSPS